MISAAEAERLVLESMPQWASEDCALAQAHGRTLRAGIAADRDLPPFDRATMDGYALRASAPAAGERRFRVEAIQAAGSPQLTLGAAPDACVEIMTGAVVPAGADAVVPYEDTVREGDAVSLAPGAALAPGNAIHRRGGDHRAGEVIVAAGTRLTGREIAVAAACGRATVAVARLPRIAVVASGDELVEVGAAVAAHQVRRSNDHAVRAALAQAGFPTVERFHVRDVREEVERLLGRLIAGFDVILLSGGVSKGKFDFLPEELGRQRVREVVHGVAQRPGKPFWFGLTPRRTPVFALPGNPVSTYVCLHRYVLPALGRASGLTPEPVRTASLAGPAAPEARLTRFLPVKIASGPRAELLATPVPGNTSGDFASLVGTDGFVELPARTLDYPAGHVAPFWAWS